MPGIDHWRHPSHTRIPVVAEPHAPQVAAWCRTGRQRGEVACSNSYKKASRPAPQDFDKGPRERAQGSEAREVLRTNRQGHRAVTTADSRKPPSDVQPEKATLVSPLGKMVRFIPQRHL